MKNFGKGVIDGIRRVGKTDHTKDYTNVKQKIRENVLGEMGADNARVFDAYAGSGTMYRAVWRKAAKYVGCDTKFFRDHRMAFAADNMRVMRAIDLTAFNVFDLDSYGSPWPQVLILAARRPVGSGEKIGLVITDGSAINVKLGGMPYALAEISGISLEQAGKPIRDEKGHTGKLAGASRDQDYFFDRAILGLTKKMACRVVRRWQATGNTGMQMRYVGLVLSGL